MTKKRERLSQRKRAVIIIAGVIPRYIGKFAGFSSFWNRTSDIQFSYSAFLTITAIIPFSSLKFSAIGKKGVLPLGAG